jgi:hypothetical protein
VLAGEADRARRAVWWGRGWEGLGAGVLAVEHGARRWLDQAGDEAVSAAAGPWRADLAHVPGAA